VEPGTSTCIVGASGSGKSLLAAHLTGAVAPTSGRVTIDGIDLNRLAPDQRRTTIGYLPQVAELFPGSIAANIRAFREHDAGHIVTAARLCGIHEMILRLPEGYATDLAAPATRLSRGLQQRIALARAVCGQPALVVLDEPHTAMDAEGDAALAQCIKLLREHGSTVITISHRAETLGPVDQIIVMRAGTVVSCGAPRDVLGRLSAIRAVAAVDQQAARRP
jgi:ATP-binding cassette subfamily C protein/ATP-binding cassette subfamily C protein EexD